MSLLVRKATVTAAAGLGALSALGCLLAGWLELQGFGAPRDAELRWGYLVSLALGFAVSVGAPVLLRRVLLPGRASLHAGVAAAALAAAGGVLILGLSFR